ncbi:MAG: hypothetical protein NWF01_02990, partial [Candidatus Bathyarchaeota archaeon]|nr:hypothetical protein [Candidatus Bathyarchaeota archaeon]
MSALKHGFFRSGFMLCDRCVQNGDCKQFRVGGECAREKRVFGKFVRELCDEFELEGVADRILVERVAMYLIRIARAEAYESFVGVSEKSVVWGGYISRLDNTLRGLMNDLAVTRVKRLQLEKSGSLLVSVDELIRKFANTKGQRSTGQGKHRRTSVRLWERI